MVVRLDQAAQTVANVNKDRRACRVASVLLLLVVVVSFNYDLSSQLEPLAPNDFGDPDSTTPQGQNESPEGVLGSLSHPPKVQELLGKLREMSRLAADGHDYALTAAKAWHEQNPCQSRSELHAMYATRKYVRDVSSNPMWDQVFDEYTSLHRICMKKVGNVSEHFRSKSNVSMRGCKFVLAEGKHSLGNMILVTASALLYAIVTQRVLLVPSWMTFTTILCEPFVGSSWILQADSFPMPHGGLENNTWEDGPVFVQNLDHRLKVLRGISSDDLQPNATLPPLVDALVVAAIWQWQPWMPEKWFFCSTEQRFLAEVPWIYFSGSTYSIPDLFGSAPFGPTLQALFPDKIVITQLLRSAFLPSDNVWSRFTHLNHVNFNDANRRVGIQLRFFDDRHEFMSGVMNDRVLDCALRNGILPNLNESGAERPSNPEPPITTVFTASLHSELRDHVSEFYLRGPTVTGEALRIVQITARKQQQSTAEEEDREAMVEMLLLSVSDRLLVTPVSAFGATAQAYGGLTPWIIRASSGVDGLSCERGQTIDPCQQNTVLGYDCPNDLPHTSQWRGVVGNCLEIDLGERIPHGTQILDHHLENPSAQEL